MSIYDSPEGVQRYIAMAEGFDGAEHVASLRAVLPALSEVLELGSGPGKDIALLGEHFRVTGSDRSKAFLERLDHPDLLLLDAVDLATTRRFDAVYSNKVLQHLEPDELERSFRRQAELLRPGGVAIHTLWAGEGVEVHGDLRAWHHSLGGLEAALPPELEVVSCSPYAEMEDGDSLELVVALRAGEVSPGDVLDCWFGELRDGAAEPEKKKRWFAKDPGFDRWLERRFGQTLRTLADGGSRAWRETPQGRMASIVVLDQWSRNIHRDTPGMYAADALVIEIVEEGIRLGHDRELPTLMRTFFYTPFMHAEDRALQARGVELFTALAESTGDAYAAMVLKYAHMHADIVERFGRFPHRNAILGRASTDEELEFLSAPGSSF